MGNFATIKMNQAYSSSKFWNEAINIQSDPNYVDLMKLI
jgi:hypothetical protein